MSEWILDECGLWRQTNPQHTPVDMWSPNIIDGDKMKKTAIKKCMKGWREMKYDTLYPDPNNEEGRVLDKNWHSTEKHLQC